MSTKPHVIEWGKQKYEHVHEVSTGCKDIRSHLSGMDQTSVEIEEIENESPQQINPETGYGERQKTIITRPTLHGNVYLGLEMLSDGTREIYERFSWQPNFKAQSLNLKLTQAERQNLDAFSETIIQWEEPENSINPKIQKTIPSRINAWFLENCKNLRSPFIFVTTHSPFVLKEVGKNPDVNEQIILLDDSLFDDKPTILEPERNTRAPVIANKLLGAGISDLLPRKVIIAEQSIVSLLEAIAKKIDIDIQNFFSTSGGDEKIERRLDHIRLFNTMLSSISSSWPEREYLSLNYLVLLDDQKFADKMTAKFKGTGENDPEVRVVALSEKCLEETYPLVYVHNFFSINYPGKALWDGVQPINKFLREELELSNTQKGICKQQLAKHIANEVKDLGHLKSMLPKIHDLFTESDGILF